MRVLVLTSANRSLDNRALWQALGAHVSVDLRALDATQQRNLGRFLSTLDMGGYQRVVVDLMFKLIRGQYRVLRRLPGLICYEEDAYLDFMPGSRWRGAFLKFYRRLPGVQVISTGFRVAGYLRAAGVLADCVPKGFDPVRMSGKAAAARDIELGFIGRLSSKAYAARRAMLESLAEHEPLKIMRTHTPQEYVDTLLRIRCFVSADIGLSEYMAKNFEAMACGCLLLAKRQGGGEEEALGLRDGENVLLYDDLASLCAQVIWMRLHPESAQQIAERGRQHVHQHNSYPVLAAQIAELLARPCAPVQPLPWWRLW